MALEDAKNPIKGVSGPGKYAKRLDRIPANQYGDQTQIADIASGAPLAKTPDVSGMPAGQVQAAARAAQPVTPLFAPTERPNEPVTHGVDIGAGGGSEALNIPPVDNTNFRATIRAYMPVLSYVADLPNTSPETRNIIRQLRDQL